MATTEDDVIGLDAGRSVLSAVELWQEATERSIASAMLQGLEELVAAMEALRRAQRELELATAMNPQLRADAPTRTQAFEQLRVALSLVKLTQLCRKSLLGQQHRFRKADELLVCAQLVVLQARVGRLADCVRPSSPASFGRFGNVRAAVAYVDLELAHALKCWNRARETEGREANVVDQVVEAATILRHLGNDVDVGHALAAAGEAHPQAAQAARDTMRTLQLDVYAEVDPAAVEAHFARMSKLSKRYVAA